MKKDYFEVLYIEVCIMQILGIILVVVGFTLFFVGRSLHRYLPPDYNEDDRESVENALLHTGKLLSGAGIVFIVCGVVCAVAGSWSSLFIVVLF